MNTKFYVGQRVRGPQGQVVIVLDPKHDASIFKGILVDGPIENQPIGYISSGWLKDSFVDFPIYPPRVVLTEWQKKQLREYVREEFKYTALFNFFDRLESILSEPEPPKYQPKKGEAVLVRDSHIKPWLPAVALGEEYIVYTPTADTIGWSYCRPFDASLVGKVTND